MNVLQRIPFQEYKWIANSFDNLAYDDPMFEQMVCNLANSGVSTIIIPARKGPIVVTWKAPLHA